MWGIASKDTLIKLLNNFTCVAENASEINLLTHTYHIFILKRNIISIEKSNLKFYRESYEHSDLKNNLIKYI